MSEAWHIAQINVGRLVAPPGGSWHLDRIGPSEQAFTFKMRFPAPAFGTPPIDMQPDPWCAGRA